MTSPRKLDFTGKPATAPPATFDAALATQPQEDEKPDLPERESRFKVRNVLEPATGLRHDIEVVAIADAARNLGPEFYARMTRLCEGVPFGSVPFHGQQLAGAWARIQAMVVWGKDAARTQALLIGDEQATLALGEALLRFELRWFREDGGASGAAPIRPAVELPWSEAGEPASA